MHLTLSDRVPEGVDAVLLFAVSTESPAPLILGDVPAALGSLDLVAASRALRFTGALDSIARIPTLGASAVPLVVLAGLGTADEARQQRRDDLRRVCGGAARTLEGCTAAAVVVPPFTDPLDDLCAVAESLVLGAYRFDAYRSTPPDGTAAPVERCALVVGFPLSDPAINATLAGARQVTEAVALCRDLVNTPASEMTPDGFVAAARAAAAAVAIDVSVLDVDDLSAQGFGGILGVGQGSVHPPRLLRLAYIPEQPRVRVALIGKGITFDSGGLDLKDAASMLHMKSDMAGAAAVLAAVIGAARRHLRVGVTAWMPLAENMPSGAAIRPSDVLRLYGGKTVEVTNTDAEGRLVLADALTRAAEEEPDVLVDIATLTGAHVGAVGRNVLAIMSNDPATGEALVKAGSRAGEVCIQLPLQRDLRRTLDSRIADLSNSGGGIGALAIGGIFLREFVPAGMAWAHIDIGGAAFNADDAVGERVRGATGVGVRTLLGWLESLSSSAGTTA